MASPLLTMDDVCERLRVSPRTIRRWLREGKFPQPIRLGDAPNSPLRWPEEDIQQWLDQRRAASQPAVAQVQHGRPR